MGKGERERERERGGGTDSNRASVHGLPMMQLARILCTVSSGHYQRMASYRFSVCVPSASLAEPRPPWSLLFTRPKDWSL